MGRIENFKENAPSMEPSAPDRDLELESLAAEGIDEEEARRAYEAFRGDFVDDF